MVYSYKWEGPKHTPNGRKKYVLLEIKVKEEEVEELLLPLRGRGRVARIDTVIDEERKGEEVIVL